MMNIDDFIRFQHDLLNQQKDQKSIQKETIKLVALLSQNVIFLFLFMAIL